MTNEVDTCQKFKNAMEQAEIIGLKISAYNSTSFQVFDASGNHVMTAPTLDTLYYVLYGWDKCFEKYRDRITTA